MTDTTAETPQPHPIEGVGKDSDLERDRFTRWIVFLLCTSTITLGSTAVGTSIAGLPGFVVGLAVGAKAVISLSKYFIIRVPQAQVFVTLNGLRTFFGIPGDANVKYGTGDHVTYPWESRDEKGNLSLDIITLVYTESVPGKDSKLEVTGSMQFRVDIKLAERFIGVDQSTIVSGIVDLIKAAISGRLATKTADEAKAEIEQMNIDLLKKFGLAEEGAKDPNVSKLENVYGIELIAVTVTGIDLPQKVQETRDALDQAEHVLSGVAKMYGMELADLKTKLGNNGITTAQYNEMLDRFLANTGVAKMDIKALKINDLDGVAKVLGEIFQKRS
jgi:hypothetical protein